MKFIDKLKEGYKRGTISLNYLPVIVIGLVVAGLMAAFSLQVLSSIRSGMGNATATTAEYNATGLVMTGISNLTTQFGNIGLIGGAIVIIGLLVVGFGGFMGRGK